MKPDAWKLVSKYRVREGKLVSTDGDRNNGAFMVPYAPNGRSKGITLGVIASDGEGWDHVSVSLQARCPSWEEMCFIKDLFFEPHESVMQLHPAKADYVNWHPYCLHLWRPQNRSIPLPPLYMIGPKE